MEDEKTVEVRLGSRRRITLPREACEKLGVQVGDALELVIEDSVVVVRLPGSKRQARALESLRAIREAFQRSGVTEEELQAEGRRVREEVYREMYGPAS